MPAGLVSVVLALAALGCGGDEEVERLKEPPARGETTGVGPTATAPGATTPPPEDKPPSGGTEPRG
ncbi:MAG: hypothetical protein M3350_01200, partial [Actinomycetota bacterium]|nr:hypothetical protein [Actinomycetota bacterium]